MDINSRILWEKNTPMPKIVKSHFNLNSKNSVKEMNIVKTKIDDLLMTSKYGRYSNSINKQSNLKEEEINIINKEKRICFDINLDQITISKETLDTLSTLRKFKKLKLKNDSLKKQKHIYTSSSFSIPELKNYLNSKHNSKNNSFINIVNNNESKKDIKNELNEIREKESHNFLNCNINDIDNQSRKSNSKFNIQKNDDIGKNRVSNVRFTSKVKVNDNTNFNKIERINLNYKKIDLRKRDKNIFNKTAINITKVKDNNTVNKNIFSNNLKDNGDARTHRLSKISKIENFSPNKHKSFFESNKDNFNTMVSRLTHNHTRKSSFYSCKSSAQEEDSSKSRNINNSSITSLKDIEKNDDIINNNNILNSTLSINQKIKSENLFKTTTSAEKSKRIDIKYSKRYKNTINSTKNKDFGVLLKSKETESETEKEINYKKIFNKKIQTEILINQLQKINPQSKDYKFLMNQLKSVSPTIYLVPDINKLFEKDGKKISEKPINLNMFIRSKSSKNKIMRDKIIPNINNKRLKEKNTLKLNHRLSVFTNKANFEFDLLSEENKNNSCFLTSMMNDKTIQEENPDPYFYYDEDSYKKALDKYEKDKLEVIQQGIIEGRVNDVKTRIQKENQLLNTLVVQSITPKLAYESKFLLAKIYKMTMFKEEEEDEEIIKNRKERAMDMKFDLIKRNLKDEEMKKEELLLHYKRILDEREAARKQIDSIN